MLITIPGQETDTSAIQNSIMKTPSPTVKPSNMTVSSTANSKKLNSTTYSPGPNLAAKTASLKRSAKKPTLTAPSPLLKRKREAWKTFLRTIY